MPGHEQCWLYKQRFKAGQNQSVVYRTDAMLLCRFRSRIDDEHKSLIDFIEKVDPAEKLGLQAANRLRWCLSCPYNLSCRVKTELNSIKNV